MRCLGWFETGSGPHHRGVAGVDLKPALAIDQTGRLRVARWRLASGGNHCPAGELPLFSGIPGPGHNPPTSVDVQHTCDDQAGCDVTSAAVQHLCVPFRDGW